MSAEEAAASLQEFERALNEMGLGDELVFGGGGGDDVGGSGGGGGNGVVDGDGDVDEVAAMMTAVHEVDGDGVSAVGEQDGEDEEGRVGGDDEVSALGDGDWDGYDVSSFYSDQGEAGVVG